MAQKILTYRGRGQKPEDLKAYIENELDLKIIDSFGRNIIIEGSSVEIDRLIEEAPKWRISAVKSVAPPKIGAANVGRLRLPGPAKARRAVNE